MTRQDDERQIRYSCDALIEFARRLAVAAGLAEDRAAVVAGILLEADLMGHTTHGLGMLPDTLKNLEAGLVRKEGEPHVVADHGCAVVWDAANLPGPWLMSKAIEEACRRARAMPVVTYVIRRAAHINCLGAYLRQATDQGMLIWLMNSAPNQRLVAPAGSLDGQLGADPIAFGYPTEAEPILIDISTSPVANGWIRRWAAEGRKLPDRWLQDAEGNLSDDPKTLFGSDPPGSILPLGGTILGHKGFALGLMVEVMTAGLAGTGRANLESTQGGSPVFLQIINPDFFSGVAALKAEASCLAGECRKSRPRPGHASVRMPGDTANSLRSEQMTKGVALHPSIMPQLEKWAAKLHVPVPQPFPA